MGKIKIGENEYRLPVTIDSCEETYTCISDENCKEVSKNDMVLAINELAQLRAERDALKARVEELENENAEWKRVLNYWREANKAMAVKLSAVLIGEANRLRKEPISRFELDQCICVLDGQANLLVNTVLPQSSNTTPGGDE